MYIYDIDAGFDSSISKYISLKLFVNQFLPSNFIVLRLVGGLFQIQCNFKGGIRLSHENSSREEHVDGVRTGLSDSNEEHFYCVRTAHSGSKVLKKNCSIVLGL